MRKLSGLIGLTLAAAALTLGASAASAQATAKDAPMHADKMMDMAHMKAVTAKELTWAPLVVPGFDPGTKMAVVSGDPNGTGTYTLRLDFPAGYKFPAHWHPNPENLTVLSGTLELGMGDVRDDKKLQRYTAGDFLWIDGKHPHFGGAVGPTVIQLHGTGPFTIELSTPMMMKK